MNEEQRDRIKLALFLAGINQVAIAKTAGVHKSFITNILRGRKRPSQKVKKAFQKYGIDLRGEAKND